MLIPKIKPARNEKYRKWISELPCCLTGVSGETQCCHISRVGMGIKASDYETIPMSFKKHAEQHSMNEAKFWAKHGKTMEDVYSLANALNCKQFDTDAALMILARFKRGVILP